MLIQKWRRSAWLLAAAAIIGLSPHCAVAAEKKINVAYSSISGNMAPLWVAYESGLFRKHNLDVNLVFVEGGSAAAQALAAGEAVFAQMAGAGVIHAALSGADPVMIAGVVNTFTFQFVVAKDIARPEQLKGKSVGVTRFGSSTDFATRYVLDKYGLQPEKDVAILQLGTMPALLSALESRKIQGAMLSAPFTLRAKKAGFPVIADMQTLGLEYQHTGLATRRATIKSDPELVRSFVKAYVEGIHYYKTHRQESLAVLEKYLNVDDPEALAGIYEDIGLTLVPKKPYPTLRGIRTILMELAGRDPAAARARPEQFADLSFIGELDKSGFIDRLYPVPALTATKATPAVAAKPSSVPEPKVDAAPLPIAAKAAPALASAPLAKSKAETDAGKPVPVLPAKTAPRGTAEGEEYTVQPGDTLEKLAVMFYGSPFKWERIYAANRDRIRNPDHILVGQKIILPPA